MKVGDLVYARNFLNNNGISLSHIGVIREISPWLSLPYLVWFLDLGYGVSFAEDELVLLEDYHAGR